MSQLDLKQIGLWVLIWLIGYGLGLLEGWFKERARNKEKPEEKPKPEIIQAPPQLIEEDYILAIFEESNELSLKIDKTKLENRTQMNEEQRKYLISLIVRLRPWLEGSKAKAPTPAPKPAPTAPRPVTPPPVQPAPQPPAPKPASQPIVIEPIADDSEYKNLGMVGQINWILQKKLEHHPLKSKRIRLEGALTGGVIFYIGEERYEYIDEIPYPEVKAIIQEAIAEWEERSTPRL